MAADLEPRETLSRPPDQKNVLARAQSRNRRAFKRKAFLQQKGTMPQPHLNFWRLRKTPHPKPTKKTCREAVLKCKPNPRAQEEEKKKRVIKEKKRPGRRARTNRGTKAQHEARENEGDRATAGPPEGAETQKRRATTTHPTLDV